MARVLGLDLGSHTLKGIVVETTYRGATVKSVFTTPVPPDGERLDRLKAALPKLFEQGAGAVDSVVVSLPGTTLATHPIALPFSDPKKIESTLAFEVESQLPYDLDDAVFDHQVSSADEKGALLLVGVARKTELQPTLDALKEAKLDPRIVTHAGLVYQNLIATLPPSTVEGDAAVAVLDLGHERCSLAIGKPGGSVEFARTFAGGGWSLTKALSNEFKISLADAAAWKEEHGAVGSEVVGAEAERASGAFMRALQPVLRDLRSSLKSYNLRSNHRPVGALLLCGGTSKLKGLPAQLGQDLNLPTQLLELPVETREVLGVGRVELAQAYALALRGTATGAKAPRFNLRRGEFAFKSDFDFASDKLGQLAAFAVVLFVLLIASGIVRNSVLERREKQVDAVLCEVTQRILGKCEKDFTIALSMLKGQESPAAGIPQQSATLLAELTSHVPPDMKVTFDKVTIGLDRISLSSETENSKSLEELIAALKTYRCFKEVNEGRVEKSKDGTKVMTRLEIQVECPTEAEPKG
jgi:general secretion pathway protein L